MKMKGMKQLKAAVAAGIMALSLFAGSVGAMAAGGKTPDGYEVDELGRWCVGGTPQSR